MDRMSKQSVFLCKTQGTVFPIQLSHIRQSTRLSLQSSELGPPPPSPAGEWFWGGTHSLAGDGVGGSLFGRGYRHCGTLGIYCMYFVVYVIQMGTVNLLQLPTLYRPYAQSSVVLVNILSGSVL